MAGIGFELRRMLHKQSLSGRGRAYAFAAIIGSGPWVLSIVAILAIGLANAHHEFTTDVVGQFQVSITCLMAASLIMTSPLQLLFTRFVADRLFEQHASVILSNLFGALLVTLCTAGIAGTVALSLWFNEPMLYRLCMLTGFVTLCGIWIVVIFASAIKAYQHILLVFLLGYGVTFGAALGLRGFGLEGLLVGFVAGQACLFFTLLALVVRQYAGDLLVSFDFMRPVQVYPSLVLTGLFYNIGLWIDKFIFWTNPLTSVHFIGPLHASPLYDLPIFLSYLSLIPGLAIFLIRVETELADKCEQFYLTITRGGTLGQVTQAKQELVGAVRSGLLAMLKVQGATTAVLLMLVDELLVWFGISALHRTLLSIDLVAVVFLLLLMAILNVLFYLDQRLAALRVCLLFCVSNTLFSALSLYLGPAFYGYGFAFSVALTVGTGLLLLLQKLDHLEYETFMLQPVIFEGGHSNTRYRFD